MKRPPKPGRVTVSLEEEHTKRLEAIATAEHRSLADAARLLILQALPAYEARLFVTLDKPKIADVGHHR